MSLTLEIRNQETGQWLDPLDEPIRLGERAKIRLTLRHAGAEARMYVGDVLMASTLWEDQAEYYLHRVGYPPTGWQCLGKLFRDWVGEADVRADVLIDDAWISVASIRPIYIEPERLRPDEFAALCDAVAAESADLLYDVYGKTGFGSAHGKRSSVAPAAIIARVRHALDQLATALSEISRQPAYRLKTYRVREPALPGQAISDQTLEEACIDPGLAITRGGRVRFREHVREVAAPNYKLEENHLIANFLGFLRQQVGDLRAGLRNEIHWRQAQRPARDRPRTDGGASWWATEDRPRIAECNRIIKQADLAEGEINRFGGVSLLAGW